ncbi:MAG: hypothetical protein OXC11_13270 [Rhodospirillales bacterium]|nr:hypothetical protein [Rhodospirillales bacterium]
MAEPSWDLKSEDGLRAAVAEAEKRIDPNRLARVTKFLEEVAAVPQSERASEEFQRRIWRDNPIHDPGYNAYEFVGERELSSPELRTWFADQTNAELPTDWKERGETLADVFWEAVDHFKTNRGRPRRQMLRTLATLFPEHLTGAVAEDRLYALQSRMGSSPLWAMNFEGVERECRDQALYSFGSGTGWTRRSANRRRWRIMPGAS